MVIPTFFLEMKEDDEEGVGTMLSIDHKSMAHLGDEVMITATVDLINGNEMICTIEAICNNRLIAVGKTAQKMLKKEKLYQLMNKN